MMLCLLKSQDLNVYFEIQECVELFLSRYGMYFGLFLSTDMGCVGLFLSTDMGCVRLFLSRYGMCWALPVQIWDVSGHSCPDIGCVMLFLSTVLGN